MSKQQQIRQLSDRDHVRLRKGMYIPNINYCVYEIVDNSIDEFIAGYGNTIYLKIEPDRTIMVVDEGRGLPIDPSLDDPTKSQAELALGSLKAGGKFGLEDGEGYDVKTGGLNGVGSSAINFLSEYLSARIYKNGTEYGLDFIKGEVTNQLYEVGPVDPEGQQTGTLIQLQPDVEIWQDDEDLDLTAINDRMKQLTYLNPGLTIMVDINYDGKVIQETYCHPEGLKTYVEQLSIKRNLLTPIWSTTLTHTGVDISLAFAYSDGYSDTIYAYTNNILNSANGSSHLTGLKEGIFRAVSNYYTETNDNKTKINITSDDAREGLIAILSIKVKDPNFEGQGKDKLTMPRVRTAVRIATEEYIAEMLDKNPDTAKIIISKAENACKAREAAKRAREAVRSTKGLIDGGLPGKLANCKSKNPEESELFLVEGDSAAGTSKKGRDKHTQAILPVFGKILNVEKSRLEKVLQLPKLKEVIKAMGCSIGEEFDITKLKYHKIIPLADADYDGAHIQALWITFFYRFYRPIIEAGYLYLACPPLFKISKKEKGKTVKYYAYTVEERDALLAELGKVESVDYLKGLGEMNHDELWDSTLNPATRKLKQVRIEDIEKDEEMLVTCMGEEVAPRKEFIMLQSSYNNTDECVDEDYEALADL